MNNWKISMLKFKKLSPEAELPTRETPESAGLDIKALNSAVVPARGQQIISTGLALELPRKFYARVAPKSGLAALHGIDVGAGIIDADYRGDIKVLLFNHSDVDFHIAKGRDIAQIIIASCLILPVTEASELSETSRGKRGFGDSERKIPKATQKVKPVKSKSEGDCD